MKALNPEKLKSKSLRIASVFIHPLVTGISYCLDVLFECGRTRGLQGTFSNPKKRRWIEITWVCIPVATWFATI